MFNTQLEEAINNGEASTLDRPGDFLEGKYWPDINGTVYNVKKNNKVTLIKPFKNNKGYHRVTLIRRDKTRQHFLVHRLVFECFHHPIEPKHEIDHLDSDLTNNCLKNLEEVTKDENLARSKKAKVPI